VSAHVHGKRARCTRGARVYLQPVPTKDYLCQVPVGHARCDEYRAHLGRRRVAVRLLRRQVDCVLPLS
jgi:hypothetical protein